MHRILVAVTLAGLAVPGLAGQALAAEPATIEATGEAAITGNRILARERALEDALRNAVEQAAGTLVSSETRVQDSQLVSDKILTRAGGYVKGHEVLETRQDGRAMKVRVRAKVGLEQLADDLAAIGLTLARQGMPRLALLIAEQRIDELEPAAWWVAHGGGGGGAGGLTVDQRVAENTLIAAWQPAGFTFVDLAALAGQVRQAGIVTADLSAEQVREIKDLSGCDVVVTGSAVATKEHDLSGMMEPVSGVSSKVTGATCTATVSVRALNSDNGEILAAVEASARSDGESPLACGRDATAKATRTLAADLQQKLLGTWSRQLDTGARLTLRVAGVDTLSVLNALVGTLREKLRGVKDVQQRRFGGGSADLDVMVTGSAQAFASELEEQVVKGKRVEVTGLSANAVELRLVK